ncbi:MAG: hypothetical protein LBB74_04300 [Chitinispirillales bacterium]|nr:hypothetical protein [Chitinispirillales bacterium]
MMDERKNYRHSAGVSAVALILIMAPAMTASASMSITAAVSADSAMPGDALSLDVVIAGVPRGAKVVPPETDKGFGEFSVLEWEDLSARGANANAKAKGKDKDKSKARDSSRYQYRYGIAAYRPENCTIPSLRFLVCNNGVKDGGAGDTAAGFTVNTADDAAGAAGCDTLFTPPIPIRLLSVLPAAPPDSGGFALKDLKAQQGAGRAGLWYLWVILGTALAVAAFFPIRKYLRKKKAVIAPVVNLMPPYEEAIGAIDALDGKKYLERGMVREYVFELSEIFKRYIGRRYDTIAPELTTEELTAWLEFSDISREMRLCAERFFRSSDRVKFAKWVPDRQCIDGYIKDVRTFIEATKPDPMLPYERKTERIGVTQ